MWDSGSGQGRDAPPRPAPQAPRLAPLGSALFPVPFAEQNVHGFDWKGGSSGWNYFYRNDIQQYYVDAELVERPVPITLNGTFNGTLLGRMYAVPTPLLR